MVDIGDLKSPAFKSVWVRVPPWAHLLGNLFGKNLLHTLVTRVIKITEGTNKHEKSILNLLRTMFFSVIISKHAPVAQLVEQLPLKEMVRGSNPRGRTVFD